MITVNVKKIYYKPDEPILNTVHFTVDKGEIATLMGPSGLGKSTLLKMIAGLHQGFEGEVQLPEGIRVALLSQNKCLLPWKTVYENVILLKRIELKKIKHEKTVQEKALKLIEDLGLKGFEKKYPRQLSGGQYQRAALGQAFFYEPDILLMDEPFTGLDDKIKKDIQDLFLKWQSIYHMTTIFVTHHRDEAHYMGSRIIDLERL